MKRCPKCNKIFDEDWLAFCTTDGEMLVPQESPVRYCRKCGAGNSSDALYCHECDEILLPSQGSSKIPDLAESESDSPADNYSDKDETTFICYARKDADFVSELVSLLKQRGVRVWMDQLDLRPGENWDKKIDDALYSCNHFLIVLSPTSVDSDDVRSELLTALDEGKHIVPVLFQSCRMPRQLRSRQYIDFASQEVSDDERLAQLVSALGY